MNINLIKEELEKFLNKNINNSELLKEILVFIEGNIQEDIYSYRSIERYFLFILIINFAISLKFAEFRLLKQSAHLCPLLPTTLHGFLEILWFSFFSGLDVWPFY